MQKFKKLRNNIVVKIRTAKKQYSAQQLLINRNTASWWSTINTFMKSDIKTPIPPLNVDDTVFYSEQEKANAFNDFFVSQTKLENNNQECPLPPVYNFREHLTDIELNIKPVIFVRYYNRFL